ncbi:hypothetical protein TrVE_jg6793 [Triparma verrucosa]|uniref:Uncharacterized protein n=1 Tax=Triparma verrucosa TaxID=1606542 RepID=A0A9W7BNQ5_9STRA|nr:hypothetical protein TrVE_jg6793 [Triparma verrucosa]
MPNGKNEESLKQEKGAMTSTEAQEVAFRVAGGNDEKLTANSTLAEKRLENAQEYAPPNNANRKRKDAPAEDPVANKHTRIRQGDKHSIEGEQQGQAQTTQQRAAQIAQQRATAYNNNNFTNPYTMAAAANQMAGQQEYVQHVQHQQQQQTAPVSLVEDAELITLRAQLHQQKAALEVVKKNLKILNDTFGKRS